MNNLPATRPSSLAELYPLRHEDGIRAIVQSVLTFEKQDGKPVLHRHLTSEERAILTERRVVLSDALQPAHAGSIKAAVSQMLAGFNKSASKEDANAIASQFAVTLQSLPLWAIKRACGKFARGEVTVKDVEGINRAFGPTTAQLYQVASDIAAEWFDELRGVRNALAGIVPHVISDEERERVGNAISELAASMKRDAAHEQQLRRDDRARRQSYSPPTDDSLREHYARERARRVEAQLCSSEQAERTARP